jgi:hypothetical protein
MKPRYTIEVWPHGWLICGPGGAVPLTALGESSKLFPKTAVLATGIPHHFRASGRPDVVLCVASLAELRKWSAQIEASIAFLPPEERWWKGLDVGSSSAAVFAVFCHEQFRSAAQETGRGAVPRDADDFGRCARLLTLFPQWRENLSRVAAAYPETKWPALVARWSELEAATPTDRTAILSKF